MEVDIENRENDLQPISGYHVNDKSTTKLIWDNIRRVCRYSTIVIKKIIENGGKLHSVKNGYIFEKAAPIFSNVAKTCLFKKTEAKAFSNWVFNADFKSILI